MRRYVAPCAMIFCGVSCASSIPPAKSVPISVSTRQTAPEIMYEVETAVARSLFFPAPKSREIITLAPPFSPKANAINMAVIG